MMPGEGNGMVPLMLCGSKRSDEKCDLEEPDAAPNGFMRSASMFWDEQNPTAKHVTHETDSIHVHVHHIIDLLAIYNSGEISSRQPLILIQEWLASFKKENGIALFKQVIVDTRSEKIRHNNKTPLSYAIAHCPLDVVKAIIEAFGKGNRNMVFAEDQENSRECSLFQAVSQKKSKIVEHLLALGANPMMTFAPRTAFSKAVTFSALSVAKAVYALMSDEDRIGVLMDDTDYNSKGRWSILHSACNSGVEPSVFDFLLDSIDEAGVSVSMDYKDNNGRTPFYYACEEKNVPILRHILKDLAAVHRPSYYVLQRCFLLAAQVAGGGQFESHEDELEFLRLFEFHPLELVWSDPGVEVHTANEYHDKVRLVPLVQGLAEYGFNALALSFLDAFKVNVWHDGRDALLEYKMQLPGRSRDVAYCRTDTARDAVVTLLTHADEDIVTHHLISDIVLKLWNKIGRKDLIVSLAVYVVLLLSLAGFSETVSHPDRVIYALCFSAVCVFTCCVFMWWEVKELLHLGVELKPVTHKVLTRGKILFHYPSVRYFGLIENYINIFTFVLTPVLCVWFATSVFADMNHVSFKTTELFHQLLAIDTLFLWIGAFPYGLSMDSTSVIIRIILEMMKNTMRFFVVLSIFIFSFAVTISASISRPDTASGFDSLGSSIYTLFRNMVGDSTFENLAEEGTIPTLYLALFSVVVTILMLNFLIALMASSYETIYNDANRQKLVARSQTVAGMLVRSSEHRRHQILDEILGVDFGKSIYAKVDVHAFYEEQAKSHAAQNHAILLDIRARFERLEDAVNHASVKRKTQAK